MPQKKYVTHRKRRQQRRDRLQQIFKSRWVFWGGVTILILAVAGTLTSFSAMQLENRDSFCASCHSQPESTYFDRTTASTPVDMASYHTPKQTRCIDCHSGSGLFGRPAALLLGARDMLAWVTKTAKQPAPLTFPIGDGTCLKCHGNLYQAQDFNNHFHLYLSSWQSVDPKAATCVTCHQAHTTDGDPTIMYMNQQRAVQVCDACHAVLRQ